MDHTRLRRVGTGLLAVAAAAALAATPVTAFAKTKTHKDPIHGFECRVEDSWEQVPPKPGGDDLHIAAEWKDPSPKYGRFSADQPTFRVIWTVTPKGEAPAAEGELPDWAKDLPPEMQERVRLMQGGTKETLDGEVNQRLQWLDRLFGPYKPLEEHYADRKKPEIIKTKDGLEVDVVEINYQKKRPKDPEPNWWMWVGRTGWENEKEKVEVGFYGYVDLQFAKEFKKQFESTVRSFQLNEVDENVDDAEMPDFVGDPNSPEEQKVQEFIRTKIIKGWKWRRTPHYLIVYDEDVDNKRIVNRVAREMEALREQVYEVIFPPDKPVEAISIIRILEDQKAYSAYGAPGGSAGYWSPYHGELVLYQDKNDKKDAIRVLYHEGFHQYIYYSVGEVSPHSWFNEGHGDFFSGHVFKGGKFKLEPFGWRTETAREAKRRWAEGIYRYAVKNPRPGADDGGTSDKKPGDRLTLAEWLTWRQPQYYGSNDFAWTPATETEPARPIPGGVNYALGWSFIYFLRTTKNEQYQKILPTYFNTLKSFVTHAREKALGDSGLTGEPPVEPGEGGTPGEPGEPGAGGDPDGGDPTAAAPAEGETTDEISRGEWHGESLKEAFRGIDMAQLEKDWLAHSW